MAQTLEHEPSDDGWDEVRQAAFGHQDDAQYTEPTGDAGTPRGVQGRDPAQGQALHPWAREMYRQGLSFNGNERHRAFVADRPGHFVDLSDLLGADSPLDGRALLAADLDRDGDLDLFAHNIQRDRHSLWRNDLPGLGSALTLRLRATRGQHEAIGATVVVEGPRGPVAQVLARGGGFASGDGPELTFGLGGREGGAVRVRWPGRSDWESFGELGAGRWHLVESTPGGPGPLATPLEGAAEPLRGPWPDGLKIGLGERVSALRLLDRSGSTWSLDPGEVAEGDELWVHFWASYCAPCVAELEQLDGLVRPGRRVLALSLDGNAGRARALELLDARAPHLEPGFVALDDADGEPGLDLVVDLLALPVPTTLVLGAGGRLERVLQGSGALDR